MSGRTGLCLLTPRFGGVAALAYALQQLINGVTLGMIYGLIAVGYTMVYGIIGMINFAHGDIFMIGAFLSLIALLGLASMGITAVPIALALTLLFAAALAALYGWTVERVAYRPLRGSFRLAPLISAIGMSITLQNFVQVSQGARVKPMDALIPGGFEIMEADGFAVRLHGRPALPCRQLHPGEFHSGPWEHLPCDCRREAEAEWQAGICAPRCYH